MEQKKTKALIPAICMISVLIMIIWGTIEGNYEHSWLAVFGGGILIAIISIMKRENNQ